MEIGWGRQFAFDFQLSVFHSEVCPRRFRAAMMHVHHFLAAGAAAGYAGGMWYVYVLRCADGTLYTGVTNDLERRLADHNAGKGARYTRTRRPVEVVYSEQAADRGAAQRRESEIKRMPAPAKQQMVEAGPTRAGA